MLVLIVILKFASLFVTKIYVLLFLNDRQGALDDCLSNQHTIKLKQCRLFCSVKPQDRARSTLTDYKNCFIIL